MVLFSCSDCSKCTPFYVIFAPNSRKYPFQDYFWKKHPLLAIHEQPAPRQKHPPFTRFCCCIPTSRPSDPPGTPTYTHSQTPTDTHWVIRTCWPIVVDIVCDIRCRVIWSEQILLCLSRNQNDSQVYLKQNNHKLYIYVLIIYRNLSQNTTLFGIIRCWRHISRN
jgi:hypothetical protein